VKALFSRKIILYLSLCVLVAITVFADENSLTDNSETNKIRITAEDSFIYDHKTRQIEFVGNVKATQKNTIVNADRMQVFLKPGTELNDKAGPEEGSISKIVAKGNVKIKFDDRVATSEHAVYTTKTQVLILTGEGSTVMSGDNHIAGEKITLYRTDGRIVVESSTKKSVEAILHSGENGLK